MRRPRSITVILLLLSHLVSISVAVEVQIPPWQEKHKQLQLVRNTLFNRLEDIQSILVRRTRNKYPALLARLSLEPVEPRVSGYGLLPEIQENGPFYTALPNQTVYSMRWLEDRLVEESENAENLFDRLSQVSDLESLVTRFEDSIEKLRHLENQLSYQEQWQKSLAEYPAYFQKRNSLIAQFQEIESLRRNDGSEALISELSEQLRQEAVSFKPTPGLALVNTDGGERVLPVTICTDIESKGFLQAFKQGVDEAFNQSLAAGVHRFSLELNWRVLDADFLYPEGAPRRGDKINVETHLSLFKDCPLILTTGASSTNAWVGERIVLGTDPERRRTLAHEFGHLLGFEDAYLRGYTGDPNSVYGVEFVEWTGLTDDLMGNPGGGRVSSEMIETLLTAY